MLNNLISLYPKESREKDIRQMLSYVKSGISCQLIGMPGVGRENVFGFLAYNRPLRTLHLGQEESVYHFLLINFAELRGKPTEDVAKLLLFSLSDSLAKRGFEKRHVYVAKILKESLGLQDALAIRQGLKKALTYLTNEEGLRVIFFFDRFEEYVGSVTGDFFVLLDALQEQAGQRFACVFALTRPLEQIIEQELFKDISGLLVGHIVYLQLYDEPSITFRLKHFEDEAKITLPEGLKDEVNRLCGGHRRMTKVAIEELLRSEKDLDSLAHSKNEILDFLLQSIAVRSVSYDIWNALLPAEQVYLKSLISQGEKDEANNEFLQSIQIIKDKEFTIPLFEHFVRFRVEHSLDEQFSYKEDTQDILKGKTVITGKFTSSEYKLLSFILQNTERIIERDEIVSHVWSESKSTAGITDQAVDQLIFRLRRKIETDPNNPRHLQTVKGRGFLFTR